MSASDIAINVLLAIGVAIELLCCIGVMVMRNPYARLHYISPAGSLGIAAIAVAVIIKTPTTQAMIKAIFITIILLISGPILSHAIARAAKNRDEASLDVDETQGGLS